MVSKPDETLVRKKNDNEKLFMLKKESINGIIEQMKERETVDSKESIKISETTVN